ncbi:hypothetical protein [Paenibacillus sp. UNC451MF]|uniref:hypothetical protein n=1 Tax=Paenibacillus sp. UNC451MF TaxID=1449063 RepID=UPI00048DB47B|nr:hypothetical protein [Paenibacillus sp. UNC451MF]
MISNRELKGQIEQITEQQQSLTDELQQIKELLQSQSDDSSGQDAQQSSGGQSQQQNSGASNSNSGSISDIAKDFSKLKDLTSQLETKMQEYISNNSKSQPLSDEDAINLVLSMMNGMIDWSMDLMSKQSSSNGQSGQLH